MAVRRVVLCIGDITMSGRPVSELTAIDPTYDDPQTDFLVWNIQAQAWQNLTPGTNSNTSVAASNLWAFESRLREGLRDKFPTETLYLIKHTGVDTDVRNWSPDGGATLSALITQVTNAAAAANGAGDTLSIDAIAISLMTEDHALPAWRSYGNGLRDLIEYLRAVLGGISFVDLGTLRNDGGLTPVVILEPHYDFDTSDGRLVHCRMQAQMLENADNRVRVCRTHSLFAESNDAFAATAYVLLGDLVADHFYLPVIDDEGSAPAKMTMLLGDSTAEGTFTNSANLPAHQQDPLAGVKIFNPTSGEFETLQVGVNNLISWIQVLPYYGIEIGLTDRMRDTHDVWLIKGSQINSHASDYRANLGGNLTPVPTPPHGSFDMISWAPGGGQLCDMAIRGWFLSGVKALRSLGLKPELELVVISVGLNDTLNADADALQVKANIESMIRLIKKLCDLHSVSYEDMRIIVAVPPSYAVNGTAPFDTVDESDLNTLREDLLLLSQEYADVSTIDLSNHAAGPDSYHQGDAGVATFAKAAYDLYIGNTANTVSPLFCPDADHLRKALRLSKVADDNDAWAMIDNAVQTAKSRFFQRLGQSKIEALQAIAYTNDPRTSQDYLRIVAVDVEIKMVRAELIRSLPLMFKDGSAPIQIWNDEGAFREGSYLQTEKEITRLNLDIERGLDQLYQSNLSSETGLVEVFPTDDNPKPGATVFDVI